MTYLYAVACVLVVTRAIDYVLGLIERRLTWLKSVDRSTVASQEV
jgi:hypothetical protein